VWTGTTLLIWGGASTATNKLLGDGAAYNPSTRTWTKLPRGPLSARADASATWDGTAMLVWGGTTHFGRSSNPDRLTSSGAAYNPTTRRWTVLPKGPLPPRDSATMLWTGKAVVIFGGVTTEGKGSTQGATYQPATGQWTRLPSFPKPARGKPIGTAAAWTGHDLVIVETYETIRTFHGGGGSVKGSSRAAAWQEGSSTWEQLPALPPKYALFYQATGVWTGRQVILVGGTYCLPDLPCPLQESSEMDAYDPTTRRWSTLPDSPLVDGDPIVWTGRAVALFAGFTPATAQVYDPRRGAWYKLPHNRKAALSADAELAIWTGKQLLVWATTDLVSYKPSHPKFYALTPRRRT
jgi:hypothetical protein